MTISVTEAELAAVVTVVQDTMYVYRMIMITELHMELPISVEINNSGTRDLANSWSMDGRTRHIDVQIFFSAS